MWVHLKKVNVPGKSCHYQLVTPQEELALLIVFYWHRMLERSKSRQKKCSEQGISLQDAVHYTLTGPCHAVIPHFAEASIWSLHSRKLSYGSELFSYWMHMDRGGGEKAHEEGECSGAWDWFRTGLGLAFEMKCDKWQRMEWVEKKAPREDLGWLLARKG